MNKQENQEKIIEVTQENLQINMETQIPYSFVSFRGHRPGFIDVEEPLPKGDVKTLDELLALKGVVGFSENAHFSGYALSIDPPMYEGHVVKEHTLMATYKDGKEWWVIGYVSANAVDFGLPVWEANKPGYVPGKEKEA